VTLLLLKLGLTPALIGLATIVSRRWGPAVGGLLIALPFTSFPVLLLLALDQGTAFAAKATEGSLAGAVALAAFCLTYARAGGTLPWWGSFLSAAAAFAAVAVVFRWIGEVPLPALAVAAVAAPMAALLLLPEAARPPAALPPPWWDLPARMVVGAGIVVGITSFSTILGPELSGLLATFPVFVTVLAIFTHRREGPARTVLLLRGALAGMFATLAFFILIRLTLVPLGIAVAFPIGLAAALAIQAVMLRVLRRTVPV
jgi:hypothetical protein